MKPLLTICEEKAKSEAHVEHLMVLGCDCASFVVSSDSLDERLWLSFDLKFDRRDMGRENGGVIGLPTRLDGAESVGDVLKDGGESLGKPPVLVFEPRRLRRNGIARVGSRKTGNLGPGSVAAWAGGGGTGVGMMSLNITEYILAELGLSLESDREIRNRRLLPLLFWYSSHRPN